MPQPASEPDLEFTLPQRAALLTALMMGRRYGVGVRRAQSRAAKIALVVMLLTLASLVWFTLRTGAPSQRVGDRAMGVSFDMPAGWRRLEAHQSTRFLKGNYHWVPDSLLQEIAEHLSHPEYGLVLIPADAGRPFIVISKRGQATAPLTQRSAAGVLAGEGVHFSRYEMGPVRVIEGQGGRIFSTTSSASLDAHSLLVRHDTVVAGENAYVMTWVGPAGGNPRMLDGVSRSLSVENPLAGGRWVAAGMIQLWLLSLVVGLAVVALQIYRRMG